MAMLLAVWTAAFAGLNYLGLRKWEGPWRNRGWIPTMMLVCWDFYLLATAAADPTSHNLWPVEVVGVTVLCLIVLAFITIASEIAARHG